MSKRKVIFFDIDGTLIDYEGVMPPSTITALAAAKQRGHKLIICTGRSMSQINPWILQMDFDGVIAASGAYVELDGKVLSESLIPVSELRKVVSYFEENDTAFSFQTAETVRTTKKSRDKLLAVFEKKYGMGALRLEEALGKITVDDNIGERADVEKFIYFDSPYTVDKIQEDLGSLFYVTAMSYKESEAFSGEVTLNNITKAYGIQIIENALGLSNDCTVAFGDGPNDIEMLQYANLGIAMGNGTEEAKKAADYITSSVEQNGIEFALKKLEII